jgi:hypothetical protein
VGSSAAGALDNRAEDCGKLSHHQPLPRIRGRTEFYAAVPMRRPSPPQVLDDNISVVSVFFCLLNETLPEENTFHHQWRSSHGNFRIHGRQEVHSLRASSL